ncbi:MAG: hypothetical protein WAL85_16955 [Candidatus Korobacteraceae bacterium]
MRLSRQIRRNALQASVVLALVCASFASSPKQTDSSPNLDRGFQEMYNLDFPAAHETFRAYQQVNPQDPMGYVSNAAAYLFSEFDRLHILESDLFTDDHKFEQRSKLAPDPAVKTQFDSELAKSDAAATKILAQNPNEKNALFSQVLANGLRGDYTALIEKRNLASLSYMKTSRTIAEKLLVIDPICYDAYLAVGVENYLLGLNPAPVRWFLRVTGSQTDKEQGLQRLRLTAEKGHYLAPFARLLLAVAALRDKDRPTARVLLAGLAKEFPNNQLYVSELARIQ